MLRWNCTPGAAAGRHDLRSARLTHTFVEEKPVHVGPNTVTLISFLMETQNLRCRPVVYETKPLPVFAACFAIHCESCSTDVAVDASGKTVEYLRL